METWVISGKLKGLFSIDKDEKTAYSIIPKISL